MHELYMETKDSIAKVDAEEECVVCAKFIIQTSLYGENEAY